MGIVIRQSFWGSALMYTGVAVGYINTLLLMPKFLDMDDIGLIRLIQSNAMMILPLSILGMNGSLVKYYPSFKQDETLKSQVLGFQLLVIFLTNLLIFSLVFLFDDEVNRLFVEKSARYNHYLYITLFILLFQSYFEYLLGYSRSELNIIFPSFLKEVFLRVCNLTFILLYGLELISFEWVIYLLTGSYLFNTLVFVFFLTTRYGLRISFNLSHLDRSWLSKIVRFSGYILLLSIGVSIIQNIGFLLTSTYLGLEANGIFTICTFIGIIIEMPKRAASQIIGPLVANNFKNGDLDQVEKVYQKASTNLGVISILIATGIVTNLSDLFHLIPKGDILSDGFYVVLAVGLSKVISMFFGPSGEILTYSKYKNYMLYLLLTSALIMIILNITLIPVYGLNGAALAVLLTIFSDQFLRFILIRRKLGFTLFTFNHVKLLIVGIFTLTLFWIVPFNFDPVVNIFLRSLSILALFLPVIYLSKISSEFNNTIHSIAQKFKDQQ